MEVINEAAACAIVLVFSACVLRFPWEGLTSLRFNLLTVTTISRTWYSLHLFPEKPTSDDRDSFFFKQAWDLLRPSAEKSFFLLYSLYQIYNSDSDSDCFPGSLGIHMVLMFADFVASLELCILLTTICTYAEL